jgi:hypothetical protein
MNTLNKLNTSQYVPTYIWNDDERDTSTYIPYRACERTDSYEYIPVYKIMKEYYEEEMYALYANAYDDTEWNYDEGEYFNLEHYEFQDGMSDVEPCKDSITSNDDCEGSSTIEDEATSNPLNNNIHFNRYCYS